MSGAVPKSSYERGDPLTSPSGHPAGCTAKLFESLVFATLPHQTHWVFSCSLRSHSAPRNILSHEPPSNRSIPPGDDLPQMRSPLDSPEVRLLDGPRVPGENARKPARRGFPGPSPLFQDLRINQEVEALLVEVDRDPRPRGRRARCTAPGCRPRNGRRSPARPGRSQAPSAQTSARASRASRVLPAAPRSGSRRRHPPRYRGGGSPPSPPPRRQRPGPAPGAATSPPGPRRI